MEIFKAGLRCQDVHAGLRNVDPSSGGLTPLLNTRLVGMAASLASFIRGRDVIADGQALQAVAAEQLDVDPYAFPRVVELLEEIGVVEGVVRDRGGRIARFTESIPYYNDMFVELGSAWRQLEPTQLEEEVVAVVDRLAGGPVPQEELSDVVGVDKSDLNQLLEIGRTSQLIKVAASSDGAILYSPFYAFENPSAMNELVATHGTGQLAEEFAELRSYQGLPVDQATFPALSEAISKGFVLAPSVQVPGGGLQPFASLPYVLARDLLTIRKAILEKALAVVACLRCGQHFGGYNDLTPNQLSNVIDKLLDPDVGVLRPHSSHERQYSLMHRAGLIAFDPDPEPWGTWVQPRFIDTPDNREAMEIARDLLHYGERMDDRVGVDQARSMLNQNGGLTLPMQTVAKYRTKATLDPKSWTTLIEAAMGHGAL